MKENIPRGRTIKTNIIYGDKCLIRNVHDPEKSHYKKSKKHKRFE